jgi:hypothetical protein
MKQLAGNRSRLFISASVRSSRFRGRSSEIREVKRGLVRNYGILRLAGVLLCGTHMGTGGLNAHHRPAAWTCLGTPQ